jgi:dUTPase
MPVEENVVESDLNNHHRDTLRRILSHPASGNIEWREVLSLLNAVGTVDQERNGKVKVTVGAETEVLDRPRGKDIDVQMVVDLRRMLRSAGFA